MKEGFENESWNFNTMPLSSQAPLVAPDQMYSPLFFDNNKE
jgi:hypothetical protein